MPGGRQCSNKQGYAYARISMVWFLPIYANEISLQINMDHLPTDLDHYNISHLLEPVWWMWKGQDSWKLICVDIRYKYNGLYGKLYRTCKQDDVSLSTVKHLIFLSVIFYGKHCLVCMSHTTFHGFTMEKRLSCKDKIENHRFKADGPVFLKNILVPSEHKT